jgi:hypothetical protein
MNSSSAQLGELIAELHEVNAELADAARPLERLPDLDDDQRQRIAARIRTRLGCWESVSQRIGSVLGDSGNGCREEAP